VIDGLVSLDDFYPTLYWAGKTGRNTMNLANRIVNKYGGRTSGESESMASWLCMTSLLLRCRPTV